ncbi:MAG: D-sedoheptulose 7-phosphate isomerase [Frankiales bacterium]|jgi:D-sedoheptulose 7-phosphate isomerase|nr:D-sedoheptulose 7-phosphate isomerase [Frankiales bacterium]MDX6222166.1 D-sedoheptulose 7-phosphate isomerase [Frankiales bacterium]
MSEFSTPRGHQHIRALSLALQQFGPCVETAERWGADLARTLLGGGRLIAAGNGGSAAQAQHLTAELVGRYRQDRRPFSAICLTAETSTLTAIANDYPPDELYARQVEAHARPGDIVVLLSTSGRSPNVVEAARRAKAVGARALAFSGPSGNPLAETCHEALCVESPFTATVQELHLVALHLVCASLDHHLAILDRAGDLSRGGTLEVVR